MKVPAYLSSTAVARLLSKNITSAGLQVFDALRFAIVWCCSVVLWCCVVVWCCGVVLQWGLAMWCCSLVFQRVVVVW